MEDITILGSFPPNSEADRGYLRYSKEERKNLDNYYRTAYWVCNKCKGKNFNIVEEVQPEKAI